MMVRRYLTDIYHKVSVHETECAECPHFDGDSCQYVFGSYSMDCPRNVDDRIYNERRRNEIARKGNIERYCHGRCDECDNFRCNYDA